MSKAMIPVHVYRADLRLVSARAAYFMLDDTERQRADTTSHPAALAEFVKTRALLRSLLARYTGRCPSEFEFGAGKFGKPHIKGDDTLHFNVSHSGGTALVAVAHCAVGIDIERIDRTLDHLAIAESIYSRAERDLLLNALPQRQRNVFFSIWTRKEAYLKATGSGFSANLELISTVSPDGRIKNLNRPPCDRPWYALDLPAPDQFRAALVAPSNNLDVSMFDVGDFLDHHGHSARADARLGAESAGAF